MYVYLEKPKKQETEDTAHWLQKPYFPWKAYISWQIIQLKKGLRWNYLRDWSGWSSRFYCLLLTLKKYWSHFEAPSHKPIQKNKLFLCTGSKKIGPKSFWSCNWILLKSKFQQSYLQKRLYQTFKRYLVRSKSN